MNRLNQTAADAPREGKKDTTRKSCCLPDTLTFVESCDRRGKLANMVFDLHKFKKMQIRRFKI